MVPARRAVLATAALNVGLHVLGLAVAWWGMRPGTPLVPLDVRLGYLAARPPGWTAGWAVWMLCALALVAFLAALAAFATAPRLAAFAVALGAAGAAVDLLCDTVQITVLPDLAAWRPPDAALFFAVERGAGAGGTVVANGLYSLAVLLAALALRDRLPLHALGLGAITCGAGLLMVAAGFSGDAHHVALATGPTIGAFLLWTIDVAWGLSRPAGEA
jgi:hypothetical protein